MSIKAFRKKTSSPLFRLFLLRKLPLAFFAGVKIAKLDDQGSVTVLKYRWINQNPFRSTYFAAMQMSAELSTGLLLYQYQQSSFKFSMLLVRVEADYIKKAVGRVEYRCNSGLAVDSFIKELDQYSDGNKIEIPVIAYNESNEEVAKFRFTWSCKKK